MYLYRSYRLVALTLVLIENALHATLVKAATNKHYVVFAARRAALRSATKAYEAANTAERNAWSLADDMAERAADLAEANDRAAVLRSDRLELILNERF